MSSGRPLLSEWLRDMATIMEHSSPAWLVYPARQWLTVIEVLPGPNQTLTSEGVRGD